MNTLKAVVFDADGTLLNSFELIYSAYRHVSETHNLPIPTAEEVRSQMGNPIQQIFSTFYPGQDIETLLQTNYDYVAANKMKSEAFEGVDELLSSLNNLGLKLAILTSGGAQIDTILKHHRWEQYFSSVVHVGRIAEPKPDAEGFLLATRECGAKPEEALMVGDTVVDIETGRNAGALATIALTHGFGTKKDLENANPDFLVDDLAAILPIIRSSLAK